ncbi:unnamed protein product [Mucor hiemalis]
MHDNTFTTSELLSIQLNDIVMLFKCSTECHRQLVWLFNTAIENVINDLERDGKPKILHAGSINKRLRDKTEIKAFQYDICRNSCMLFDTTKNKTHCTHCKESRYRGLSSTPFQTMKMMSIGDQLDKLEQQQYKTRASLQA